MADRSKSSATVQKQKSRSPSSARTSILHQEEVVPQEWETDCLRVDAMKLAAYTSTKLHDEFRAMEYDASEKYEFHRNKQQEFAV